MSQQAVAVDINTIKEGLKRLLPILKTIAALTPNKLDDAAVLFLTVLLGEDQTAIQAAFNHLRAAGHI